MILRKRLICAVLFSVSAIAGCDTAPPPPPPITAKAPLASLQSKKALTPPVIYAFQLIKEEKYKEASRFLNVALQNQPKNPIFHILNGMVYEKLAATGDESGFDLAIVGYQNALNIDPSNLFAVKQLAKIKALQKEFGEAQELFANALLIQPENPEILHELAAASYYAYDIKTAMTAIRQAEKLKPQDPLIHRSAAMIHAAVGDFPAAQKHFEAFKKNLGDDIGVKHVAKRLQHWTDLYESGRIVLTPAAGPKRKAPRREYSALSLPLGGPGAPPAADPMVIVDCYLLRVQEDSSTKKGVNLIENLALSLNPGSYLRYSGASYVRAENPLFDGPHIEGIGGSALTQVVRAGKTAVPYAYVQPAPTAAIASTSKFDGHIFQSGLTWGALNYSMNIAQASDERTEVVSRPSLMTFLKKQCVFFSGEELVIGLAGQYGGTLVTYPVGTTLIVTPEKLEDDMVTMTVTVEGSIILQAEIPNLRQTVQVGKTRIDTQVKMRLGDTLMLGGMYERVEDGTKKGVPGLRDVPLVQYFFSTDVTQSTRRSIVIMITPRSTNVVRVAVDRAMQRGPQPCLAELATRRPDWFNSVPNMIPLFQYLAKDPVIYHEFRSGDILPPSWGWEPSVSDKLAELESFLYY